jgi:hypothetical protein
MRGLRPAQLRSHSNDKLRDIRDHINTAACAIAPCDQAFSFSQEKRPAGITPPAFSCNCRLPVSGSVAIPCLKFDHHMVNEILTSWA